MTKFSERTQYTVKFVGGKTHQVLADHYTILDPALQMIEFVRDDEVVLVVNFAHVYSIAPHRPDRQGGEAAQPAEPKASPPTEPNNVVQLNIVTEPVTSQNDQHRALVGAAAGASNGWTHRRAGW